MMCKLFAFLLIFFFFFKLLMSLSFVVMNPQFILQHYDCHAHHTSCLIHNL